MEDKENAFKNLKQAPTSPPMLVFSNRESAFLKETDTSSIAIGAVLSQERVR